ncbi:MULTISPECIES: GNAT family N-acetyltransferase [unclassified Thioalkalivibrio]|uniref:GNAT family N-acetyltransferase n=1 Tax=unclassified Thioalkalivibrio TaxID=2621013 RepID=UPI0003622220|nr:MULTISPECIES: GNAT family N-acetyltransferase [unclassified Thioalkalivibrio]
MEFRTVSGAGIAPYLEDVARLRIAVFREWPYLYEGSAEYEARYLQDYVDCPDSTLVLALDGDRVVGASTALPLVAAEPEFQAPFRAQGLDPVAYYYLAESVLEPAFRGQGAGHRFFDEREAAARRLGFSHATFCAVVRPDDHPRRPPRYRSLDGFWEKRGYSRAEGVIGYFPWPDIGEAQESLKPLQFWWRRL